MKISVETEELVRVKDINNNFQVCTTCEFNGDMHPQRYGEDVLEGFKNGLFQNYGGYERFVIGQIIYTS